MTLIRPSQIEDLPSITAIYAHHVLHGTGTFEVTPPTPDDMANRRLDVLAKGLPYLVATEGSTVLGSTGRRFLVRKLKDEAPRTPALDEIRSDVVLAWKTQQARPLAEKAAQALADSLKKDPSKLVGEVIDGKPVITTQPVVKLQPGLPLPGQFFQNGPPSPSDIPEIPLAGEELRDAYFDVRPGQVVVAHDQPESRFYVMSLNSRLDAPFAALYAPNGDYFRYRNETFGDAMKQRDEEWMNELRKQAGLAKDWEPSDEVKNL